MDQATAAALLQELYAQLVECDRRFTQVEAFFAAHPELDGKTALAVLRFCDIHCDCEAMLFLAEYVDLEQEY